MTEKKELVGVKELFTVSLEYLRKNPVQYLLLGMVMALPNMYVRQENWAVSLPLTLLGVAASVGVINLIHRAAHERVAKLTMEYLLGGIKILPSYLWVVLLSAMMIFLGTVFFIIPGIIVAIHLSFACYAIVLDEKWGTSALWSSYHLVKGHAWQVFIRLAALYGIVMALVILGLVCRIDMAVWRFIVYGWFAPLSLVYGYFLYASLKKLG